MESIKARLGVVDDAEAARLLTNVPKFWGCNLPYCQFAENDRMERGCNAFKQNMVVTKAMGKAGCVSLIKCTEDCRSRSAPPQGPCKCEPTADDIKYFQRWAQPCSAAE